MEETQPSCRLHVIGIEQVLTRPIIYSQLLWKWREDFKQSSIMAHRCISVGDLYTRRKGSEPLQPITATPAL